MKDLLWQEESLYDFLGIAENSSRKEILSAISQKMLVDVKKVSLARHNLLIPQQRAYHDLLFYNDKWLQGVSSGSFDRGLFYLKQRHNLAQAWEAHLKNNPYDVMAVHSLALLYFWWAIYEENNCKQIIAELLKKKVSLQGVDNKEKLLQLWQQHSGEDANIPQDFCLSPFPLEEIWEGLIGWWLAFINTGDFWENYFSVKEELCGEKLDRKATEDIKEYFKDKLHTQIMDFLKYYQEICVSYKTKKFSQYRFWFTVENRYLLINGVSGTGEIKGGPLFLKKRGILQEERNRIESYLHWDANKDGVFNIDNLKRYLYLSPFAHILILVDEKCFDEALVEIEKLSVQDKKNNSILYLLARIYLEEGRIAKTQGNLEEALTLFQKALPYTQGIVQGKRIKEEIASIYIDWANAEKDSDKKIEILEKGYKSVKDNDKLNREYSLALSNHGVKIANNVINAIGEARRKYWDKVYSENPYLAVLNKDQGTLLNFFSQRSASNLAGLMDVHTCFNCGKKRPYYSSQETWYTGKVGSMEVGICSNCYYRIQSVSSNAPKPSRQDISILLKARTKFKLAAEVDSINQHAADNLKSLEGILNEYLGELGKSLSEVAGWEEKKETVAQKMKSLKIDSLKLKNLRLKDWLIKLKEHKLLLKIIFIGLAVLLLNVSEFSWLFILATIVIIGARRNFSQANRRILFWGITSFWLLALLHLGFAWRLLLLIIGSSIIYRYINFGDLFGLNWVNEKIRNLKSFNLEYKRWFADVYKQTVWCKLKVFGSIILLLLGGWIFLAVLILVTGVWRKFSQKVRRIILWGIIFSAFLFFWAKTNPFFILVYYSLLFSIGGYVIYRCYKEGCFT